MSFNSQPRRFHSVSAMTDLENTDIMACTKWVPIS